MSDTASLVLRLFRQVILGGLPGRSRIGNSLHSGAEQDRDLGTAALSSWAAKSILELCYFAFPSGMRPEGPSATFAKLRPARQQDRLPAPAAQLGARSPLMQVRPFTGLKQGYALGPLIPGRRNSRPLGF
jgi:hypothetical protein